MSHGQHVQREHGHPTGSIGLLDVTTAHQRQRAVEHADIIEAQEPAFENVHSVGILAVHPPGEIQQQFVKHALQETRDHPCRECVRSMR